MNRLEFKDFTFRKFYKFLSIEHTTEGYYGCTGEIDLNIDEVKRLRAFLDSIILEIENE